MLDFSAFLSYNNLIVNEKGEEMNERIQKLIQAVKQKQYYVPRNYKSIGGMWTVDTWKRDSVTVIIMDEGYTTVVRAPGLDVVSGYNGKEYVEFRLGDLSVVDQILSNLEIKK